MAWTLPSISHAILATILLVLWNGFEVFDFKNPHLMSPFIILGGLTPLAWVNRSRVLLATTIGAFMLMLAFSVATVGGDLAFLLVFFSACILIAASLLVRRKGGFPGSGPVLFFVGYSVYIAKIFVLSFFHHGKGLFTIHFDTLPAGIYFFSFSMAAIGLLIWAFWPVIQRPQNTLADVRIDYYGVLITLLLVVLNTLYDYHHQKQGHPLWLKYGIEAYFVQQGKGHQMKKRLGNRNEVQVPLEMQIAVGNAGKTVIKGHRWSPIGMGLQVLQSPPPDTQRTTEPLSAKVGLTLVNASDAPLAFIMLPNDCSFSLDASQTAKKEWVLTDTPCQPAQPAQDDVVVLQPGEEKAFEFEIN